MADVIVIAFGDRKRLIAKPSSYANLLRSARHIFPLLKGVPDDDLTLFFKPEWETGEVELDASAYTALPHRAPVRIVKAVCQKPSDDPAQSEVASSSDAAVALQERQASRRIDVTVRTLTGKILKFQDIPLHSTVHALKCQIRDHEGIPPHQQLLIYAGEDLEDERTLADYGITGNATLYLVLTLRGGKPAIYLLSPHAIEKASVSVELSREWDFTIIYPLVDKTQSTQFSTSKIAWNVTVDASGVIRDSSGRGYSYLFWEAETKPSMSMTDDEMYGRFNPAHPIISTDNAVVLPFHDFVGYMETTLEILQLTVSMRTDFMTYWMPEFLCIRDQGRDIAFTFVDQNKFNLAAKLKIEPQPSTVARIFMLFGAVDTATTDKNDSEWRGMRSNLGDASEIDWAERIGLDVQGLQDETTFRAMEWGGMAVYGLK